MKYSVIFFLFIFSVLQCHSQVVDKTKEKAKSKSERRIDQKIDDGIDEGLNAIEGLFKKKKKKEKDEDKSENQEDNSEASSNAFMKMMGGGDVEVEDSYRFDHHFRIKTENFDKKGERVSEYEMDLYVSETKPQMGMKMNQQGTASEMIYDLEGNELITLINSEGQKMGTVMKLDPTAAKMEENQDNDEITYSFSKTGNSKNISGYNCDEYELKTTEEDAEKYDMFYWITTESDADWVKAMSKMASASDQFGMPKMMGGYPEDGTVIQTVAINDKTSEKMVMTVMETNMNKEYNISTTGYTFMNIGGR